MIAKLKTPSITVGQRARLTVQTSSDVDTVTVNGTELKSGKTNRRTGITTWTYTEKINSVGEFTFEVIAYNSDGLASESTELLLNVSEKQSIADIIRKLFDWGWGNY